MTDQMAMWFVIGFVSGCWLAASVVVLRMTRRLEELSGSLNNVRFGALELINGLEAEVKDLQGSLASAGIELRTPHMNERVRRVAMTPEEQLRESQERFDAAVEGWELHGLGGGESDE